MKLSCGTSMLDLKTFEQSVKLPSNPLPLEGDLLSAHTLKPGVRFIPGSHVQFQIPVPGGEAKEAHATSFTDKYCMQNAADMFNEDRNANERYTRPYAMPDNVWGPDEQGNQPFVLSLNTDATFSLIQTPYKVIFLGGHVTSKDDRGVLRTQFRPFVYTVTSSEGKDAWVSAFRALVTGAYFSSRVLLPHILLFYFFTSFSCSTATC
jgi:hypothetical protein